MAYADVRAGLLPASACASKPGERAAPVDAADPTRRPSYAMPHLGDVPPPNSPQVSRHITITERREMMSPLGNVVDVFA